MKNILFILLVLVATNTIFGQSFHGKKLKTKGKSIEASALEAKLGDKPTLTTRVTGLVEDVCQAKGCWMKITTTEGKTIRVTFKDYAFFVPKDIAGKKVTMEGIARKSETSVADLKHYAKDAGKTDLEIAKIIQPEYDLTFEAEGVIIEK